MAILAKILSYRTKKVIERNRYLWTILVTLKHQTMFLLVYYKDFSYAHSGKRIRTMLYSSEQTRYRLFATTNENWIVMQLWPIKEKQTYPKKCEIWLSHNNKKKYVWASQLELHWASRIVYRIPLRSDRTTTYVLKAS